GVIFFVFLYAPVALIVVYSFNSNVVDMMSWNGVTFDWYKALFGMSTELYYSAFYRDVTSQVYSAVKVSLTVATVASCVSTVFGTSIAIALSLFRFRIRGFYQALMIMPMMTPDIVLGIALLIFFVLIDMNLSIYTIIIGHCTFLISYVFITVSTRLADMDESLEEASADLGGNRWDTFRRITLPLILPRVIGGGLLAFIISMDDLVITYFISGVGSTTLPVFIFGMLIRGITPEINAIATLLLIFSVIVASIGFYFRASRS